MLVPDDAKQKPKIARRSKQCPVGIDLATLGRKWAIHILRSIGVEHIDRFNRILRSLPGLTARVLIMRRTSLRRAVSSLRSSFKRGRSLGVGPSPRPGRKRA